MNDEKRQDGSGSIEPHHGAWRVRVRVAGARRTLGTYETRELAQRDLDAWLAARAEGRVEDGGRTLRAYGADWLDGRELRGHRNAGTDLNRWTKHVMRARFADWPIEAITKRDVRAWVDGLLRTRADDGRPRRSLSWQTVKHLDEERVGIELVRALDEAPRRRAFAESAAVWVVTCQASRARTPRATAELPRVPRGA